MDHSGDSVGPTLAEADLDPVAQRLTERCGFRFGEVQRRSLEGAIRRRMRLLGCVSSQDYAARIAASDEEQGELGDLLSEFTNTETHFFRHAGRFRLLRAEVADGLLAPSRRSSDRLRLLSAGCSSGEEVYSSIITLLEVRDRWRDKRLEVVGCDINRRALERARQARYRRWSLRYTAPEVLARHFELEPSDPPEFSVSAEVRRCASFRWGNLLRRDLGDDPHMRGFDVILCCNVLIYMTDDAIGRMLANLRAMLADDGYLFLGYAESLQGARGEFEPVQAGDYVVYRRRRPAIAASSGRPALADRTAPKPAAPSPGPPPGPSRSDSPAAPARVELPQPKAEATDRAERAYARARALFDADQQLAALAELEGMLQTSPFHCGARLLKGYIHGSQGAFLDAAAECTKVLDVDPYLAEAYLLRATLLRQAGDVDSAIGEVRKALFLDPGLGLGQYLLGRLYQQQGEHEKARRAYANAAHALREQPERPLAAHLPFELGRDALLHQIEHELDRDPPSSPG